MQIKNQHTHTKIFNVKTFLNIRADCKHLRSTLYITIRVAFDILKQEEGEEEEAER